jgi:hypothetical protein
MLYNTPPCYIIGCYTTLYVIYITPPVCCIIYLVVLYNIAIHLNTLYKQVPRDVI